jgi:hypothetical protein
MLHDSSRNASRARERVSDPSAGSGYLSRPLTDQNIRDLERAYVIAQSRLSEARLFRAPVLRELKRAQVEVGYRTVTLGRLRDAVHEVNLVRRSRGEGELKLSVSDRLVSLALVADAHAEAKSHLDREPSADEVAKVLTSRVGRKITVKTVREKATEYNASCASEAEKLKFAPANFRSGYFPSDVLKQYQIYIRKHRNDKTPHTRRPRYVDLVGMVKQALPGSNPTLVNICSTVRWLRRNGHKVALRDGPERIGKAMLVRAIAEERARCEREGRKVTPGGITRTLNSRYPGLNASVDRVSVRARAFFEQAKGEAKKAFEFDRKPPDVEPSRVEDAYLRCAHAVRDVLPFPCSADVVSAIRCGEGTARSHLQEINKGRAVGRKLPFLFAQNVSARDLRYLISAMSAVHEDPSSPAPAGQLLAHLVGQSPHHALAVLEQIVSRADKHGICLRPGRSAQETQMKYKLGLIWALITSGTGTKEIQAAVERGLQVASEWVLPQGSTEELQYFQSASVVLELAAVDGRLRAPSVRTLFAEWFSGGPTFQVVQRLIDRKVQEILEPTGLLRGMSREEQLELLARLASQLKETNRPLLDLLPQELAERGAYFRAITLRTLSVGDADKLDVVRALRVEQEQRRCDLTVAAERLLYDPSIVARWILAEDTITQRVNRAAVRAVERAEEEFLRTHSKEECQRLIREIGKRLKQGESLAVVLSDLQMPLKLYKQLSYYYRALAASADDRLATLDRISRHMTTKGASLAAALEQEQLSHAVFQYWTRRRPDDVERVTQLDRKKAVHYFRDAYPRLKRAELMAAIYEDLQAGVSLSKVLEARWIPHDVYRVFLEDRVARCSASEKLRALARCRSDEPVSLEREQVTPEGLESWRVAEAMLKEEVRAGGITPARTLDWARNLVVELQSSTLYNGDVKKLWRERTKGFSKQDIEAGLRELYAQLWEDPPPLDGRYLSGILGMKAENSMDLLNAIFGARYVQSGSQEKHRVMQIRAELELPVHHESDMR